MRAPVQKKRPRRNGGMSSGTTAPAATGATGTGAQNGRRKRVRNRLFAGVLVVAISVIGAGAPAVLHASAELRDAQRLVTLAELNRQAVTLAHSLADERDDLIVFVAAGRGKPSDKESDGDGASKGKRPTPATHNVRVDRQLEEIRATASPGLLRDLAVVPSLRRTALKGKGPALETYRAYSQVIAKLYAVADQLAERTPADAAESGRAPVALDRAVEQASATRGLLLAALAVPADKDTAPQYDPVTGLLTESSADKDNEKNGKVRDELSAAAQQARVRELAALADFDDTAGTTAHDSFAGTVTGPDVKVAESYLTRLTDRSELSDSDRKVDQEKVDSVLTARIDQMRGAESGLGTAQLERLEKLRDDDVTGLELRIGFLGGCLLIAVGVSTAVARTLTQPLAALRIGAARLSAAPDAEAPIRYTGRNDEFAQAIRSVNALHGRLLELSTRAGKPHSEGAGPTGARQHVAAQRTELPDRTAEITGQLERLRHTVRHAFVNLSVRNLGLVERQLGVIETMEEREQDPDALATLFKLDHLATVMRRHSENLLLLAGHEPGQGQAGPVPLLDMLRAAVSEIERYERVTIQSLPPHAQVAGSAADDLSHLVAELLENATSFSPPDAQVQLSGWLLESGELMLSVEDQGIGIPAGRLTGLNGRLADPEDAGPLTPGGPGKQNRAGKQGGPRKPKGQQQNGPREQDGTGQAQKSVGAEAEGLGLRVVGLLASRHGVQVRLREQQQGGVAATVVLPQALLPTSPPAGRPAEARPAGAPAFALPGSVAEANSNALPGRSVVDPMVAAAEQAIRKAAAAAEVTAATVPVQGTGTATAAAETVRAEADRAASGAGSASDAVPAHPAPYAIGPDAHERVVDSEARTTGLDQDTFMIPRPPLPAETRPEADRAPAPGERERATEIGLPKRTPRTVKAARPSGEPTGGADAQTLSRRLGGFHQGAKDGRRDVEAELTEGAELAEGAGPGDPAETDEHTQLPGRRTEQIASDEPTQADREQSGETVEEARR
jgi:signal transduction histidine kinase